MEDKMQLREFDGTSKIAGFLSATGHVIADIVRRLLVMHDCEVTANGEAMELEYDVTYGDKKAVLYFRNLYLEIATVDRDAEPLQFDEKLCDYHYFVSKASHVIKSKLEILIRLLKSENTDKTVDEIFTEFDGERIIIEKMDNIRRKNGSK
jgi:negative regulator of replication initiation